MKNGPTTCGKVLVLQNGARHNYAVPMAFAREGRLAGFYTDACGNLGLGRLARYFTGLPNLGPAFRRLAARRVPDLVRPMTRSFTLSSVSELVDPGQCHPQPDRWFAPAMRRAGLRGASVIYSSMGWAPQFLGWARRQGVPVLSEFYVRPSHWKTHQAEHRLHPDWEEMPPFADIADTASTCRKILEVSDHLVVPSEAVKQDLTGESLFPAHRIHVIPYGIDDSFFQISNRPVPGTVLFVGSAGLMKGIHCLARAAERLSSPPETPALRFVVAGDVTDSIRRHPECSRLEFLGRVPRAEVRALYETADLLVFPTLSDSFGAVVLEAMAAGVPVVCSPYCTDAVQDGVSGRIVEPRDPAALADAIREIVSDRSLRQRFSGAARERAGQFRWSRHQQAICSLSSGIASSQAGALRSA